MFTDRHHIGLDLGTSAVRAVQAEKRHGHLLVSGVGVAPLEKGVISKGTVAKPESLTRAIREAVDKGGFKGNRVYFSANSQNVIIRYLRFPSMTEAETREALKWELAKNVPFTGKAVYDFQILEDSGTEMNVMLAAVPEGVLEEYCGCIKEAGLTPAVVDIGPLALARLLKHQSTAPNPGSLCKDWNRGTLVVADVGVEVTGLSFFRQGKLFLFRILSFGGKDIEEKSESTFEESFDPFRKLLNEFGRSIKFFQMQHREEGIDGLILTGGPDWMQSLSYLLAEEFNLRVEVLDPLAGFRVSKELQQPIEQCSNAIGVGLGLALREVLT